MTPNLNTPYALAGKTVMVTGATSGFGLEIARQCVRAGAKTIICGRREERLEALKTELPRGSVHAAVLDVRHRAEVERFIHDLPQDFSAIDVLVNNAGLALGLESVQDGNVDFWDQMIDTNIKGLTYCTRAVLPGMVARDRGQIVNIGSIAGLYPYAGGNVYGGTKAFVEQFSANMRSELLGKNIRVTIVEPGMADTEFSNVRFQGDDERAAKVYEGIEALTAGDIADAVLWAVTRPAHVNVNRLEIMPTMQAYAGFAVHRELQ